MSNNFVVRFHDLTADSFIFKGVPTRELADALVEGAVCGIFALDDARLEVDIIATTCAISERDFVGDVVYHYSTEEP